MVDETPQRLLLWSVQLGVVFFRFKPGSGPATGRALEGSPLRIEGGRAIRSERSGR